MAMKKQRRSKPKPKATLPLLASLQEQVPGIRLVNKTAMLGEWIDPAELTSSTARTAKNVRGHCQLNRT
jgi:hypothetical protein